MRSEAQSDIFATSVLLVATINIMREAGERFRLEQLIAEVIIFINIIVLFQRCKDIAKIVSHPISDYDARLEVAFAPLSFYVRLSIVTRYLEWAIYPQGVDIKRLSQEDLIRTRDQNRNLIDQIMGTFADILNDVEVGLARAMRFALFPTEREQDLLSKFAVELSDLVSRVLAETEAKAFCELAESLGVISDRMQTLRGMIGLSKLDLVYVVPWVKGQGKVDRPFGLDTKYGHLVFVFNRQGALYNSFFSSSAQSLAGDI